MRKILLSGCMAVFLSTSCITGVPVKAADYSAGAGDKAAIADMAIDAASVALEVLGLRLEMNLFGSLATQGSSMLLSAMTPLQVEHQFFAINNSWNIADTITALAHAAVNKFMRDTNQITADFTGAEGFVTDKWVGPHPRNTVTAIMGDVGVESSSFDALTFDPNEYKGLQNASQASARELMDYRSEQIIQDQRSLSNVADAQWGVLYRAQQRSIKSLAAALELKSQLKALGEVESRISADYKNKPSALSTVASRRALHDVLMALKLNVMAARTKLRSETLEVDFKPMTREPEVIDTPKPKPTGAPVGPGLTPTNGGK